MMTEVYTFSLVRKYDDGTTEEIKTTIDIDEDVITHMTLTEKYEDWLLACGYVLPND